MAAEGAGSSWSHATRRRLAMFVVLGASGNTGKVVAETLLRQEKKVRVVLHDAAKGKAWGEAGADVAIADSTRGPRSSVPSAARTASTSSFRRPSLLPSDPLP